MDKPSDELGKKTMKNGSGSRPRVISTEPDRTFARYMIEEFKVKASSSKSVPFEEINLQLYSPKAKLVGFQTSEDRLRLWLEAIIMRYIDYLAKQPNFFVTWEETESLSYPDKPDKITISVKKDDEKLFVLSIFVTTGRIQVQGSTYIQWASSEFPLLLKVIEKLIKSEVTSTESQQILFSLDDNRVNDCKSEEDTNSSDGEAEHEDKNDDEEKESEDECHTNRPLSILTLTKTLADLERNFIQSKESLENELRNLHSSLEDVQFTKDRLVCLENKFKANIVNLDDKLYHNDTELVNTNKKLNEMSAHLKKLQEQRTQLLTKQNEMKDQISELREENSDLKREIFILKEIVQKHENALQDQDLSNKTATPMTQADSGVGESTSIQNSYPISQKDHKEQEIENELDLLIMIDSNGKFIKPDLLYPKAKVELKQSYTLKQANDITDELKCQPKQVLIHCGTNDLETTETEQVINDSINLIAKTKKKLPRTEFICSSLLPRKDNLQQQVNEVNDKF